MTQAATLIKDALVDIGAIGTVETPEADDAALCLRRLNRMLDEWKLSTLQAAHYEVFSLPAGTQTRTIGTSGQVNVTHPVRIETGSFVRIGSSDYPLHVASRDQWAAICEKTLDGAWPAWVYYESSVPLGTLNFWPQGACEVHLAVRSAFTAFADLTTNYTLPEGAEGAIFKNLKEILCAPYNRPLTADIVTGASNARNALKRAHYTVPELVIEQPAPSGIAGLMAGA